MVYERKEERTNPEREGGMKTARRVSAARRDIITENKAGKDLKDTRLA